jgi:hypothetical protein
MAYGELGRYSLSINVKVGMLTFWAKMLYSNKLSNGACVIAQTKLTMEKWCQNILDECGLSYM